MVKTVEELVKAVAVTISAPNIQTIELLIQGTAPLVVERFAVKAALMTKMKEGSTSTNRKPRTARDFDKDAELAKYIAPEGWEGFNASGFRCAAIDACRLVGFKMTMAKLAVFIVADSFQKDELVPLVRIYGKSKTFTAHTRNATGVVDIRARPMYRDWAMRLRVQYDADQFRPQDIVNLISRAGAQVGIGAGRPNSKQSAGCGWGLFRVVPGDQEASVRKKYQVESS